MLLSMVRTGRQRGEYAKTAERRRSIIDASMEVFAAFGFRSGSLRDIAERVGMSQAGLLHHFPSKTHLLMSVLTQRDDEMWARIIGDVQVGGISFVRAMVSLVEHNAGQPGLVELYAILSAEATDPDHPAHEFFVRRYIWGRDLLTEGFAKAQGEGVVRPEVDPASAARTLLALMDGLQEQWLLDRSSVDMAAELRIYLSSLCLVDIWPSSDPVAGH
jgi:AcrR family transcriptional regulator